jgi:hypothetical protein
MLIHFVLHLQEHKQIVKIKQEQMVNVGVVKFLDLVDKGNVQINKHLLQIQIVMIS